MFGRSVGVIGDHDDDGFTDVVVGATGTRNTGAVYLLHLWPPTESAAAFVPYPPASCHGATRTSVGKPSMGNNDFKMVGTGLAADTLTFVLVGNSTTHWGGLVLPLDMAPFGMPNCWLVTNDVYWVSPLRTSNPDGKIEFDFPIPIHCRFIGAKFYAQIFAKDKQANAFGIVSTNGCEATVQR